VEESELAGAGLCCAADINEAPASARHAVSFRTNWIDKHFSPNKIESAIVNGLNHSTNRIGCDAATKRFLYIHLHNVGTTAPSTSSGQALGCLPRAARPRGSSTQPK
jgi:hypothetical protein